MLRSLLRLRLSLKYHQIVLKLQRFYFQKEVYDYSKPKTEYIKLSSVPEKQIINKEDYSDIYIYYLKVFSRQIYSKIAKLHVESVFLNHLKKVMSTEVDAENLVLQLCNEFQQDLISASVINQEFNEIRLNNYQNYQQMSILEIYKQLVDKQVMKNKRDLMIEKEIREKKTNVNIVKNNLIPTIAFVGFNNVGKRLLLQGLRKEIVLESEEITHLATKVKLKNGQRVILLDTISWSSEIPQELEQSFKFELEELRSAQIILHIRDISQGVQSEEEKKIILDNLLYEYQIEKSRIIEIWNKIDQVQEVFYDLQTNSIENSEFTIVPISALYSANFHKLIQTIYHFINVNMNRTKVVLQHDTIQHAQRIKWLEKNGNIANPENVAQIVPSKEFPHGGMKMEVYLDSQTLKRYKMQFQDDKQNEEMNRRDQPPSFWSNSSKYYLENLKKKREERLKNQLQVKENS